MVSLPKVLLKNIIILRLKKIGLDTFIYTHTYTLKLYKLC